MCLRQSTRKEQILQNTPPTLSPRLRCGGGGRRQWSTRWRRCLLRAPTVELTGEALQGWLRQEAPRQAAVLRSCILKKLPLEKQRWMLLRLPHTGSLLRERHETKKQHFFQVGLPPSVCSHKT